MDRIYVRDFSRADHSRNVQVAQRKLRRPNADRLVGEAHGQRVAVRLAINGDGADAQLLARADHAQGDLSAIGNQDFLEHELKLSASLFLRGNSSLFAVGTRSRWKKTPKHKKGAAQRAS